MPRKRPYSHFCIPMPRKAALLQVMIERGLADEPTARALILAGRVLVAGVRADKPSYAVREGDAITVKQPEHAYVGRGGLKLEGALDAFSVSPEGLICMDVGASTGGFTHCLLLRGAARVYAVDVGYGLLDARLRGDERVVVMERVNARHLSPELIPEPIALCSVDVSFISLRTVLPAIRTCLSEDARVIALIKPQFEAPKELVGKGGIVRDPAARDAVVRDIGGAASAMGFEVGGVIPSPITGRDGNVEYLMLLAANAEQGQA